MSNDIESRAKGWLESNTPMRWATEAEHGETIETLNRRPDKTAKRMAAFATQAAREFAQRITDGSYVTDKHTMRLIFKQMFGEEL